jgi:2-polyprenyl-3-methyl-5-hydroxy-6-metoxy-1,4-benzoquinol methylase
MVYVADIVGEHGVIVAGPVLRESDSSHVLISKNLDDVADRWEMQYQADKEKEWPALRLNALDAFNRLEIVASPRRIPTEHTRMLDFGCGWGFTLLAAKEKCWELYGIEPLPACAVYTRVRTGAMVITNTLQDDSFPPGFFDRITAFQVFEHLPNPHADLIKLHDMTAKDGIILVEVPNIDTWSVGLLRERHRHFVQGHINFFSKTTLQRLMSDVGFEFLASYHPSRHMTLSYLANVWGQRVFPTRQASAVSSLVSSAKWQDIMLSLNLRDIIAVIGRRID